MRADLLVCALLALSGPCPAGGVPEATSHYGPDGATRNLLIRGTTDIAAFGLLLDHFAKTRPGVAIVYEQWGSNDLYARVSAACTGSAKAADLVISSSVDQMVKLANDGCAQSYSSALTEALPLERNWRDEVFGITREPAVIVYNRTLVPASETLASRFDLIDLLRPTDSPYAGRVATYDIEASGLGYLFAFVDSLQATTFGSLLEAFGRSGAVATCCSAEIIDGVARGDYAIAYNVLGSYALARAAGDPNLAVVAPSDYTLVLSRAAMIPRGASNGADAGALIDFLLSRDGRSALAASNLIVSSEPGSILDPGGDPVFVRNIPLSPILLVGLDQAKRARFLELWRTTFPKADPR